MRGLILYGLDGWEDGGEFVDQVKTLLSSTNDIAFSIAEDTSFGIENNKVFVRLGDKTMLRASDDDLPNWAICRTSDWKCVYALEQLGVECFPCSDYIRTASDKVISHLAMAEALPNLDLLARRSDMMVGTFKTPYIMKEATGFGGHGVKKIKTVDEALNTVTRMDPDGNECIYQELAAAPDDLRVYIMNGSIMLAILRVAAEGSDKANFCQGATGLPYILGERQKSMIEKAAKSVSGDKGFISIDFLFDDNGDLVFNEMNCFPGLSGLVQMGKQKDFLLNYINAIELYQYDWRA